ncbi:MAG TPA: hypothetical protein VMW43_02940 [Bacteroidota bacterium]|nr:hypothetical protein [Bacteroidota bacterium]
MTDHWFWLLLTAACVVWYSTITVYVAVRGMRDIREMLHRLKHRGNGGKEERENSQ